MQDPDETPTSAIVPVTGQAAPHGFVTRGLHWLCAGLLAYGYFKGLDGVGQLSQPGVLRLEVILALGLAAIFAVRLFWTTRIAGATRLPQAAPKWEHWASRYVHMGLYASVFGIALSGLGIAYAYVTPALDGAVLRMMVWLHEAVLVVMPVLLGLHIGGALWHKLVRRDGVLESMMGRFGTWHFWAGRLGMGRLGMGRFGQR